MRGGETNSTSRGLISLYVWEQTFEGALPNKILDGPQQSLSIFWQTHTPWQPQDVYLCCTFC